MRNGRLGPEILMAIRADGKGLNLIGGRVEDGESPREAVIRETLEEASLDVNVFEQLGDDLPMKNEAGETVDLAGVYLAWVCDGELKLTPESAGFKWVSLSALPKAPMVKRPCPGYPNGRTYAMAERALSASHSQSSFSYVLDPHGLAKEQCPHLNTEKRHICDTNCQPQVCFGGENAIFCHACSEILPINISTL